MALENFEGIYLDLSKQSGKCRFAETGLGWKPQGGGDTFTLDKSQLNQAIWSRASRGYEVKVLTREGQVYQLDGFQADDFDRLSKTFKSWYTLNLENKEHAIRGWNWGKADFAKAELVFNVQSRPAFELPYAEISNANLAGKNELAVEFSLPGDGDETGTNGHLGGARGHGKKAGGARDQLVEMRFYIPGTTTTKVKKGSDDEGSEDEGDAEEDRNAAERFYDELMAKADIGEVAGDSIIKFDDILHLTPRGRFEVDLYESFFRLRGKTYDYKVQYEQIKKFMILPKPDDVHHLITIGIDPPLRQGQTRYPFLVMQFKRDEADDYTLNMTEDTIKEKYNGKLQLEYNGQPIYNVMGNIFRGLTGKKIVQPSREFTSYHSQSGVKCSIKANEGFIFCLDRSFMFVPKPATYIAFDNIQTITMSRVGGAVSASRTFDLLITMKNGAQEHQFSNINREEQNALESFFRAKNLKTKNEMTDDSGALLAAAIQAGDLDSSDDEAGAARGSADEDSEEADEDFQGDSESDVAEEYDSAHESSDGDSDADMEDGDGDADDDDGGDDDTELAERPKKKSKTSK
ncbi:SSrecog-domain-containing protein [Pseudovirgaria hyperparasitica]|uniref:FACT complex subunit POB3 n=1 Tax=Pseudovirgaria hyperparasitica TaxID=470096 RepID=A0A6A6W5J2_9PEZI|nr:SSrecog-domain-containing protein [Pseudovirgaria hyperparasitica]KAF2756321.1 SSrecog-domain-containing protein [Pseudovirgaria hyperparasitica]